MINTAKALVLSKVLIGTHLLLLLILLTKAHLASRLIHLSIVSIVVHLIIKSLCIIL